MPLIALVRYLNPLTLLVGFLQWSILMSTPLWLLSADKPTMQRGNTATGKLVKQIHRTNRKDERVCFGKWSTCLIPGSLSISVEKVGGANRLVSYDLLFHLEVINSYFLSTSSRRASCLASAKHTNVSLMIRFITYKGPRGSVLSQGL